MENGTIKIETKEDVLASFENQRWLEEAIVAIYERQTPDEQAHSVTCHDNRRGFTHGDAKAGTRLARYIIGGVDKYRRPFGTNLTGKHLDRAKRMMPKYAGQLLKIVKAKREAKNVAG